MCYEPKYYREREAAFLISTLTALGIIVGLVLAAVMLVSGIKKSARAERAQHSDARVFKLFQPTYTVAEGRRRG